LGLAAASCAGPTQGLLIPVTESAAPGAHTRQLLVVTTRSPTTEPGYLFSGERGDTVHYVSLTLSMPPGRPVGTLPTDAEHPDPEKDIVLVSSQNLNPSEFAALVNKSHTVRRRALVFVHGYNTTFDQAVVRFARSSTTRISTAYPSCSAGRPAAALATMATTRTLPTSAAMQWRICWRLWLATRILAPSTFSPIPWATG